MPPCMKNTDKSLLIIAYKEIKHSNTTDAGHKLLGFKN